MEHVFLSPHLDDVVLSCGGTIHELVRRNETVKVITVFAGLPDLNQPISSFAKFQHDTWEKYGVRTKYPNYKPYDMRRAEDTEALRYFGIEPIWFDFLECIYRGDSDQWYYNSQEAIFGNIHADEKRIVESIVNAIKQNVAINSETIIYSPIGIGHHIDHQLVLLSALGLIEDVKIVYFYQDYPYVQKFPNRFIANSLELLTSLTSVDCIWYSIIQYFSEEGLKTKIKAISAYQSQLESLFGGVESMTQDTNKFAYQIGQNKPAERYWFLKYQI